MVGERGVESLGLEAEETPRLVESRLTFVSDAERQFRQKRLCTLVTFVQNAGRESNATN